MLIALFRVCREGGCGACFDLGNIKLSWKGGCLNVVATCNSNHVTKVDFLLLNCVNILFDYLYFIRNSPV